MNWDLIEFKNEKRFMSNMYPCSVKFDSNYKKRFPMFIFDDMIYHSSEHLYQALKSKDPRWHEYIRGLKNPKDTKIEAHKLLSKEPSLFDGELSFQIRQDWDEVKVKAMELVLLLKFTQNEELKEKLLNQKGYIEERNCWGDMFWGTVNGKGKNNLGRLLMILRDKLKEDIK